MKKHLLLTLSLVALAFAAMFISSCSKTSTNTYDISYNLENFTAGPLTYGGDEDTIFRKVFVSDLEGKLNDFGVSLSDVDEIVLKEMTFTALDGGNFDNMLYANTWLRASGLDDVQVGSISADSLASLESNTVFSLTPEFTDLSEHLKQPSFEVYVKSYAKPNTVYPATEVSANFVLAVTATK